MWMQVGPEPDLLQAQVGGGANGAREGACEAMTGEAG